MSLPSIDEWGLVRSEQEESEESYFVSMTDIMVGLLFIFILMLMAFALMLKDAQQKTADIQQDIREVVSEARDEVEQIRHLDDLRNKMLQDIKKRLEERGVQVIVREENGVIQLPDEILFAKADDQLSAAGLRAIGLLAKALDHVLPCYAVVPPDSDTFRCADELFKDLRLEAVFVEGHTDSDGSDELNWSLSTRRAINTFRALEGASGVATKLRNDETQYLFSVAGYGENRLIVEETSEADKAQNRRIDLRFVVHVSHDRALERVQKKLEGALEK